MPILCSMPAQRTPLRSPLPQPPLPSTGRNLGTTNRLMPRVPAGASGSFARTRWTMFSVRSCSPALMKILVPSTRKLPSPVGTALVRIRPRSVPHCGSVRHMVPDQDPSASLGRKIAFSRWSACRASAS